MFGGINLGTMVDNKYDKWRYIDSIFMILGRIYIILLIVCIVVMIYKFMTHKNKTKQYTCPCMKKKNDITKIN